MERMLFFGARRQHGASFRVSRRPRLKTSTPPSTLHPFQGVRSDVPYIKCAVCEALAVQAAAVTDKLRADATKAKPLSEVAIMDALDRLVAPAREEGEWISTIDLVEDGTRLRVVAQGGPGKCGTECKTVAMAAADVLDSVDTDLAEALWAEEAFKLMSGMRAERGLA